MPYIKQENREQYEDAIVDLVDRLSCQMDMNFPGHLNYVLTSIVKRCLERGAGKYWDHNQIIGAIVCVLLEFYRTNTAPYEDEKIKENGDV